MVIGSTSAVPQTEALLELDTGGHKALIRDVLVTNNQKYVVSASDDKTIRVWDTTTKKEIRKILGQIGPGNEGQIFCIALSPDDQTLAAGGFIEPDAGVDGSYIRLYDFPSGRLRQLLKSHSNVVFNLHFSEDGYYLVSGSADSTIKVWKKKASRYVLRKTFSSHTKDVYAARIFRKGKSFRVVSASEDHTVRLYSLRDGLLRSYDRGNAAQDLAISIRFIAVSGSDSDDHHIHIFDHDLKLQHTITSETCPSGLSFSPDGKWLLAGAGDTPYNSNIYNTRSWQKNSTFTKHTDLVDAVTFLDNKTAITAGGNNKEIYFWDIQSAKVQPKIAGVGQSIWSVGIKKNCIAFGQTWTENIGKSAFEQSFDLHNLSLSENIQRFKRISQRYGDYSLTHNQGGNFGYDDAVLKIQRNGKTIKKVTRGATDGLGHNVYGFTEEGTILSGGSYGQLSAYDRQGKPIAEFIGHTGDVRSIAVQGERMVSGSDDQTIKVWSLRNLRSSTSIFPLVTLFVGSNGEWVLWTKSGYYNASLGGDKYVGFHINHGIDKEAEFFPSDRFYKQFYRPDIVAATLVLGSEEQAIASASQKTKTVARSAEEILPPTIDIVAPLDGPTNQNFVRLRAKVSSVTQQKIEVVMIKINGQRLPSNEGGVKKVEKTNYELNQVIELTEGANIVEVIAQNEFASSNPATVMVVYQPSHQQKVALFKPDLYLLSIGVSEYRDTKMNLSYAHEDAQAVKRIYENQEGKLFNKVNVNLLLNRDASTPNVLDAFDWLEQGVTQRDMAVVFIAGHGVNDTKDNYFFLPHNANVEKLRSTAVKWADFNTLLADLPCKTLLLVDTCKSGNVTGSKRRRGLKSNITGALKELANTESGVVVMSASTGKESSLESPDWGHGAFAKALVEGMENYHADYEQDGVITFKGLDLFVTNHVKQLTGGKQHPTTQIPKNMPDFPLIAR